MHAISLRYFYYVLVATINLVESKKYDVEEQSKLEYGFDLKSILRQFRKSADYLKILEMRASELQVFVMDVVYQSLDWNINKMRQRIEANFGLNLSHATAATAFPTTNATIPAGRTRFLRSKLSGRRQMDSDHSEEHDKIERVDNYIKLNSYLTVEERNHYKDMGFEYAGEIIHSAIHALGGSLVEEKSTAGSTRLTLPGQTVMSTTEHMLKHVPTVHSLVRSKEIMISKASTARKINRYVLVSRMHPPYLGQ